VFEVKFLADAPEHVEQLARWHHQEWTAFFPEWTFAIATQELHTQAMSRDFPTTLIAMKDEQLAGSVSLIAEDAEAFGYIGSPWLASLYVVPAFRRQGLGALLVNALVQHANKISLDVMYLFTPDHRAFYERLQWQPVCQANLHGQKVQIMKFELKGEAILA
jgi:N-acetylglutamate synthase-like GNAT family acetyltransferase